MFHDRFSEFARDKKETASWVRITDKPASVSPKIASYTEQMEGSMKI